MKKHQIQEGKPLRQYKNKNMTLENTEFIGELEKILQIGLEAQLKSVFLQERKDDYVSN